jgi:hypothetical protein
MKFGVNDQKPDILLDGKVLKWERKVKHVGNIFNTMLNDKEDIHLK